MPADRTWCPEGPREPTPEPTPEATPEPTPAPTPELPVKAPLSDNTYVYLYHIGGRWRVGPDYRNRDCWLFTKKTPNTPVSKATEWYRVDDDDNIVRSSFELDQLQESKSNVSRKFLLEHQKNLFRILTLRRTPRITRNCQEMWPTTFTGHTSLIDPRMISGTTDLSCGREIKKRSRFNSFIISNILTNNWFVNIPVYYE